LAVFTPSPASANVVYSITVDTSSEVGETGYIDIQFSPGLTGSQFATLDLTNFSTDGALDSSAPGDFTTGDVSGTLPGELAFDNGAFSEYSEGMTFGDVITATLTFDGPAIESPNGSSPSLFSLDFLSSDESTSLFVDPANPNPLGFNVATISVNPDGSTTAETYPDVGGSSDATLNQVPEPSTFVLFGAVLAGLGLRTVRNRRCRRQIDGCVDGAVSGCR